MTVTAGPAPDAADVPTRPGPPRPARRLRRLPRRAPSWPALIIALISYVPLLLTAPGWVGADTKQYLYINPDRLLARAPYLWDLHTGMGGVTHQNIGYLLPQGPWYWVFEHLRVPDWVAQRLWTGTLLFAAAMGVLALLRTFGWQQSPVVPGGCRPTSSRRTSSNTSRASRRSCCPGPGCRGWSSSSCGGCASRHCTSRMKPRASSSTRTPRECRRSRVRKCRSRSGSRRVRRASSTREEGHFSRFLHGLARWRYPALFALVVALIGGTNATSLIYAGLAPTIWLPFAIVRREVTFRDALAFVARTLLLTAAVSAWWISGLASQAATGSTCSRTPRRSRPSRRTRRRRKCCAAWATGSSTAATASAPGSSRR